MRESQLCACLHSLYGASMANGEGPQQKPAGPPPYARMVAQPLSAPLLALRPGSCRCNSGYSYKATRCYKDCPDGWNDDAVGLSCVRNSCGGDDDNGAGMCYPNCRDGYKSNGLTMVSESKGARRHCLGSSCGTFRHGASFLICVTHSLHQLACALDV